MKIAIAGGGPGGLYFAALMKGLDPRHEVTVWERNAPDDTFGFGVVFSDETLGGMGVDDDSVGACDACGFLSAMLERVNAVVAAFDDVRRAGDAEDAALVFLVVGGQRVLWKGNGTRNRMTAMGRIHRKLPYGFKKATGLF